ncbi:hypothetical protein PORY_002771 [Pneumocystis oryctolagi]|uniref:Uncharacterized protein n=1 Tax=Pneumocystis oryctolagi TaxID=42067 RepID=A0ACB7C863_9ASCO|nr:hypothetical protein PORY_002771 [Pneumocystis oryctolagi]
MSDSGSPGPSFTKIQLVIRFSNGEEDVWLNMDEESTVWELKMRLQALRPQTLSGRCLRLIYLGKILRNDAVLLEALSWRPAEQPQVVLHCNVSDEWGAGTGDDRDVPSGSNNITPLPLGFDRLREVGFSEREIALLREQFLLIHGRDSRDGDSAVWQLEEEWINQTALDNIGQEGEDVYEDMIIGASIGFLGVGFDQWLKKWKGINHFDNRVYLKQMAIIAGVMINLFFGFLRL